MARLLTVGAETGNREWNGADTWGSGIGKLQVSSSVKRTGDYSLSFASFGSSNTTYFRHVFDDDKTELYGRFALYVDATGSVGTHRIAEFRDDLNAQQVYLRYDAGTATLSWYNGAGTLLAIGNIVVPATTWIVVEFHVIIGSSGSLTSKINGTTDATYSGDTDYTNQGVCRSMYFGFITTTGSGGGYMDDIAVNDTAGSYENSWVGLGGVFWLEPTADGDQNDWTPSAGTVNYAMVDDIPPDNATTFNQALATNSIDLYEVDDCPLYIDQVKLVQVAYRAALVTSGYNELTDLVKVSGTVYQGTAHTIVPITPSFTYYLGTPYYLNPATGTAWGTAEVNAMQAGVEITV